MSDDEPTAEPTPEDLEAAVRRIEISYPDNVREMLEQINANVSPSMEAIAKMIRDANPVFERLQEMGATIAEAFAPHVERLNLIEFPPRIVGTGVTTVGSGVTTVGTGVLRVGNDIQVYVTDGLGLTDSQLVELEQTEKLRVELGELIPVVLAALANGSYLVALARLPEGHPARELLQYVAGIATALLMTLFIAPRKNDH